MGIIQRQSLKNLISAYTGILLGFLSLFVIQPRFLTPEELGLTRLLFSFSFLSSTFVPLGINVITTKYFPVFDDQQSKHHGFFGFAMRVTAIGMVIGLTILFILKGWIQAKYVEQSALFVEYFNYVFPLIFLLAIINTVTSYLTVRLKTTVPPFLNDVVVRILIMLVIILYHFRWITFPGFINLYVFVFVIQVLLLFMYLYHEESPGWRMDMPFFKSQPLRQMFGFGLLLWTGNVATVGLRELSTIMLGQYMTLDHIAIYAIAAFVPTVIETPMGALEKIAAPKITYAWSQNNVDEISTIYHKSVRYLILIGGLLFAGINTNIKDLLKFLPPSYAEGYIIVWIISISSLVNMSTGLNNSILLYSKNYKPGALLLLGLVVMNFALQILLVPVYGLIGAAIATAASQVLFNLFNYFLVWKNYRMQPIDGSTLKVLMLIACSLAIGFLLPDTGNYLMNILIRSLLILVFYVSLVLRLNIAPELVYIVKTRVAKFRK